MRLGLGLGLGVGGAVLPGYTTTIYTGARAESFSNANYFSETSGTGPQLGPGNTLVVMVDNVSSAGGYVWCHDSASVSTRGFRVSLSGDGAGRMAFVIQIGGVNLIPANGGFTGRAVLAITCTAGGQYRASVNGRVAKALSAATYTPAVAGDSHIIGNTKTYMGNPWAPFTGGACEMVWLNREATDAELAAWSGVANADDRMSLVDCPSDAAAQFWWKAATHWDGSAATSVSGGATPVAFTKAGSPTKATTTETRYILGDGYCHDSVTKFLAGSGDGTHYQRDPFARWKFTTDATRVFIDLVKMPASNSGVGLYVDGAFVREEDVVIVTGDEAATLGKRWVRDLPFSAGTKTVELYEGVCGLDSPGPYSGMVVQAIRVVDGASFGPVRATMPANRLTVFGDSISNGIAADFRTQHGWTMLVRSDYPGGVTLVGYGANELRLYDVTELASSLIRACQSSTGSKKLWLAIGTNDHGQAGWTPAAFGTAYASLVDQIHALDPSIAVWCQSPTTKTASGANLLGYTLADYSAQISTIAAARPSFCTYVDGLSILLLADLYDGVHPTTAGHAKYKTFVKTTLGY